MRTRAPVGDREKKKDKETPKKQKAQETKVEKGHKKTRKPKDPDDFTFEMKKASGDFKRSGADKVKIEILLAEEDLDKKAIRIKMKIFSNNHWYTGRKLRRVRVVKEDQDNIFVVLIENAEIELHGKTLRITTKQMLPVPKFRHTKIINKRTGAFLRKERVKRIYTYKAGSSNEDDDE